MSGQPNAILPRIHLSSVVDAVESTELPERDDDGFQFVEPHEINEQVDNLTVTNNPGAQGQQSITNLIAPQTLNTSSLKRSLFGILPFDEN
ncbi:unnamed protein product [Rhizoctonia solani]|uniref:Uncharacterized protein n=1 Tax=Rhizoctonia solani TaxID=456999 RepID=A0A8H3CB75_9AGAM|nr:unnamed protein product [Rhizoctonia solani]